MVTSERKSYKHCPSNLLGRSKRYTGHCIKSIWMFFITKHFSQFISIKFVHKHSQESNNLLKSEKGKNLAGIFLSIIFFNNFTIDSNSVPSTNLSGQAWIFEAYQNNCNHDIWELNPVSLFSFTLSLQAGWLGLGRIFNIRINKRMLYTMTFPHSNQPGFSFCEGCHKEE